MSSFDRRCLLMLLSGVLPLAACGFSPVYAPGSAAMAIRGRVRPDDPADRLAHAFVARFEARMGRADGAPWALGYKITTREVATGLNPDNVATRIILQGAADWSVRPAAGGDPVLNGRVESFTAFSATGSTTASLTARRDAEQRLMVILADQLVAQLAVQAGALSP